MAQKVKRMPALLALLLAVFAVLPAAAGAAEHRAGWPVAASPIETPAAILDHQSAEANLAEPGDSDPSDSGDAAILIASAIATAPLAGGMGQSRSFALPASPSATNRARAPPSL
jgi:hypothetical protein